LEVPADSEEQAQFLFNAFLQDERIKPGVFGPQTRLGFRADVRAGQQPGIRVCGVS
jgi:hypothetical protein